MTKDTTHRICLFAGFDAKGQIADYVVYYIKALSQIADVYYWGDFETPDNEKAKLSPYCKAIYCKRHGKYDFGSWQELIKKIGRKEIEAYDELILANDSCYGPLFNLKDLFDNMGKRDCDFWGLSSAYNNHIHLQSYFIVLNRPVVRSDVLYNFFEQVKPESDYNSVCTRYEDRFTYYLNKAGFKFSSYIDYSDVDNHPYWDIVSAIENQHFPFLKVKFFLGGIRDQDGVVNWRKVITDNTNYPIKLIEEDLERRGFNLAEIDRAVKEKKSETPDFYSNNLSFKRLIRKIGKTVLKPIMHVTDAYIHGSTAQYFYKINRINRTCVKLQQKYDELKSSIDPSFVPKAFHLKDTDETCTLNLTDRDASVIKRFDLELPLTNESDVLLLGNIMPHNLSSLDLYAPRTIFLNNDWEKELKVEGVRTSDLCGFKFTDELNRPIYFDFIMVQPLKSEATDKIIGKFITNLKDQMIPESILVMMVRNKEENRYKQILQSEGLCPANSEHGLLVRINPFQIYYDKIKSIKGYKTLIYKLK